MNTYKPAAMLAMPLLLASLFMLFIEATAENGSGPLLALWLFSLGIAIHIAIVRPLLAMGAGQRFCVGEYSVGNGRELHRVEANWTHCSGCSWHHIECIALDFFEWLPGAADKMVLFFRKLDQLRRTNFRLYLFPTIYRDALCPRNSRPDYYIKMGTCIFYANGEYQIRVRRVKKWKGPIWYSDLPPLHDWKSNFRLEPKAW